MIITQLELTHFGKFHNRTITLHDGCNLIYGPNEAGKTTIHTFIYAMLFGLGPDKEQDDTANLYQRFEPWDTPGEYCGKLWFEKDGHTFRIERCFSEEKKNLTLTDETDKEELSPAEEKLAALLSPLNEVIFRNTLLIRQMKTEPETDFASQLEGYAANLHLSGNAGIDVKAAKDSLSEQKKAFAQRLHPDAPRQKREAEEQLTTAENSLDELLANIGEVQKQQALYDAEKTELEAALQKEEEKEENQTVEKEEEEEEPSSCEKPEMQEQTLKPISRFPATFCYVACLLCLAASGIVWFFFQSYLGNMPYLLIGPLAAAWIFLIVGWVLDRTTHHRQKKIDSLEEEAEKQASLQKESGEISDREQSETEAADSLRQDVSETEQDLSLLLQEQESALSRLTKLQQQEKELRSEIFDLESEIGQLSDTIWKDEKVKQDIQAVDLASSRLSQISDQIHNSYGLTLNRETSALLARLTDGRYTSLSLDRDLHITVNTGQKMVPAEQLSQGTLDQIYFCLRIAAAKMICPDESYPLLLDDVFAFYDDTRLSAALQFLSEMDCQVILFSCHKREQDMMHSLT